MESIGESDQLEVKGTTAGGALAQVPPEWAGSLPQWF